MSHYGYHWTPCNRGGGGAAAALIALAVIVVIVARSAHAIEHGAEVVLEVLAITAASVAALAVAGGIAYVAVRVHRSHATDRQAISQQGQAGRTVPGPHRRPIAAQQAPLYVITSEHRIEEEK